MGVFTRFKDIISANLNSMLDKAEDPEKMIRLMIREMEETLVELKANCAGAMAESKKLRRQVGELDAKAQGWSTRAELAVDRGRDELAREALLEKRRYTEKMQLLEDELGASDALIAQAQNDIAQLEEKLGSAKEKQRLLIQRHYRAKDRKRSRDELRRADGGDAMRRFELLEQNIERMEAEAELAGPRTVNLEEEFARLEGASDLESELRQIKEKMGKAKPKEAKAPGAKAGEERSS